jgi:hypothetical protein
MSLANDVHKQLILHVQDQHGSNYQVRLTIDEQAANGTLAVCSPTGEVSQQFAFTQIKKNLHNTQLTCVVRGATTRLTLDDRKNPPELQVVATLFWPIFSAAYRLTQAEYQRLAQWIHTLAITVLT